MTASLVKAKVASSRANAAAARTSDSSGEGPAISRALFTPTGADAADRGTTAAAAIKPPVSTARPKARLRISTVATATLATGFRWGRARFGCFSLRAGRGAADLDR